MAFTKIKAPKIASVVSCVPQQKFDNIKDTTEFTKEEVRKVVGMAGVKERRVSNDSICSSDLCEAAAEKALELLNWERESIDALIMVTQTPDYFLPSTSCVLHKKLKLADHCAAFDVGLGCSGYTYGLWLVAMMLNSQGFKRVLLLHGDTVSRFTDKSDRSVSLLFGDAGSATAIEISEPDTNDEWFFALHSDGEGYDDLILEGGGFRERFCEDKRKYYLKMKGTNIFNFTIKRVPAVINETFEGSGFNREDIDYYILHQSNKYIINYLMSKLKIPMEKVPLTLKEFGNSGGPSIPLTITKGKLTRPDNRALNLMLLGYGVGLSWGSALVSIKPDTILDHVELNSSQGG